MSVTNNISESKRSRAPAEQAHSHNHIAGFTIRTVSDTLCPYTLDQRGEELAMLTEKKPFYRA